MRAISIMCMIRKWLCELFLQNKSPESTSVQKCKLLLQTTNNLFTAQQFLQPHSRNSQQQSQICTSQRAPGHGSGAADVSLHWTDRIKAQVYRIPCIHPIYRTTENPGKLKPTVEIKPPRGLDQTFSLAIWAR